MPRAEYEPIFEAAGREWNVDPRLLRAVAFQESGGNPTARSRAGAVGVMQIMPGTGQELGVTDLTDATQSIYGGAKYLSQMLDRYKHPELALAAYNAGPGRVDAFLKGGTLPDETLKYVPAVRGHYERLQPVADRRAAPAASVSIEDFLKETGAAPKGGPAPAQPAAKPAEATPSLVEDFLRETATPENSPAPAPQDRRQQGDPDNPVMPQRFQRRSDLGPRSSPAVETGTTVGSMADSARNIGAAAVRGYQEGSQPLPPLVTPVMEGLGVFGPAGGGTLVQGMNRQLIGPLAQLGEYALRGANGLFRGAQAGVAQAGAEIDQPQLGRDLAAIPEAFMGGGVGMPRNRLAPGMEAEAPYARLAADLERRIAEDAALRSLPQPEFLPPGVQRPPVQPPAPPVAPEFIPPPSRPAEPAPVAAESAPGKPRSVGAAASPEGAANITDRENRAYRYESEMSSVLEPQPRGEDRTIYVPGSVPTKAEYSGDPVISQQEKLLRERNPKDFDARLEANNRARLKLYDDLAGSKPQIEMQMQMRDAQAQRNLETAFKNKKDVDASPVVAVIDEILGSPRSGESEAVRAYVQPFRDRLFDAKGNLKADPERLYGIREDIAAKINKASKAADPRVANAERELIQVKEALDRIIEQGAPGYQKYLTDYREASKPIKAMELLQEFRPRMVSGKTDEILFTRFDKFMKDLIGDRSEGGISPAKSLPDETVQQLIAIHRDLKRANNIELGEARGSPTNLRGAVASAIGMPMAHAAAGAVLGPMGNAALHAGMKVVEPMLGARRLGRLTDEHLAPPPGR